jgi:hypothetical protein
MVPTEPARDCATQAPAAVDKSNTETMTAITNVANAIEGEKDETYYWETVKFSVGSHPADQAIRKALTCLSD